jgi:hypothetical protein
MEATNRRLMWHGMFLFLLGLVTGSGAAFHERADGTRSASRRGDEWHFSPRAERHLDRGKAPVTCKGDRILDSTLRYLRELAEHYARCDLRYRSRFL